MMFMEPGIYQQYVGAWGNQGSGAKRTMLELGRSLAGSVLVADSPGNHEALRRIGYRVEIVSPFAPFR